MWARFSAVLIFCIGLFCLHLHQGEYHQPSRKMAMKLAAFGIFQTYNPNPGGCPDAPPALAAGFGFNTCTFYDPMTSLGTIDVNGTNAGPSAGYNWGVQSLKRASFTMAIAGTAATVTLANTRETNILVGHTVGGGNAGCAPQPGTTITVDTGGGGGNGTYTVSPSQTLASCQVVSSFTQQPNTLSAGAGGLTISNVSQGDANWGIATYVTTQIPTGSLNIVVNPYRSTTFANGMYWRTYMTFDETKAPAGQAGCTGSPSFQCWRWPSNWATSWAGTNYGGNFIETDNCDCFSNNGSVKLNNFLHDNDCTGCSGGAITSDFFGQPPLRSTECNPVLDGTTFHAFDQLWVPTSKNGGTGIYAYMVDADTCPGNAIFMGSLGGTNNQILTVSSITVGTIAVGSYIGNSGPLNIARTVDAFGTGGTTGTGGTGTYHLAFTSTSSVGTSLMTATNANTCNYFAKGSGNQSQCSNTPYDGAFAEADGGNGFLLIFASGCTGYLPQPTTAVTSTNCNVGTTAGNWPFKVKNVQVWQTQMSDKKIQNFLLKRDINPAANDNTPMWLNEAA